MALNMEEENQFQIYTENLVIDINKVKPNDYNPKIDFNETEERRKMFEKLKKSLMLHGQVDSLKVRELENGEYELVNGYHRYMAMKELGFKEIEVKNYGKLSREEAIALALTTEEIQFDLDEIEVASLLKELKELNFNLDLLPYTDEELEEKLELLEFNFDIYDNSFEYDENKIIKDYEENKYLVGNQVYIYIKKPEEEIQKIGSMFISEEMIDLNFNNYTYYCFKNINNWNKIINVLNKDFIGGNDFGNDYEIISYQRFGNYEWNNLFADSNVIDLFMEKLKKEKNKYKVIKEFLKKTNRNIFYFSNDKPVALLEKLLLVSSKEESEVSSYNIENFGIACEKNKRKGYHYFTNKNKFNIAINKLEEYTKEKALSI